MKSQDYNLFSTNRKIYGTLGAIQKYFEYQDVPEDWSTWQLAGINTELTIRRMERMSDKDVCDLIDGICLAYSEFHTPCKSTPV